MAFKGVTKAKCPILAQLGIGEDNAGKGEDQDWVKAICRKCPYDKCVYDKRYTGHETRHRNAVERNKEIFKLFNEGKTQKELMAMFGLSRDTVRKAIKENND